MPTVGSEVTCLANDNGSGRWEGTFLTVCDPVKCVPFDPPEHGFIQGCSHEGMGTDTTESQVFPSVCTAACDDGYTPFGSVNRNCLISGIWDGLPLDCLDVTAPSIVCPDPITEFAQPRNNFVVSDFSWEPLQVVDVSPPVDVRLLSINSVGEGENRTTVFTEGLYSFLYLAVDQEGNEDTCTVDLTVRG
ncbi:Sushi-repeat-containing protein SRPX [Holothuria leucospilota]|uniref:Sushi-repeat-containing protein SRPX n=1 Tax=Holothuria leucospilota TaxID=206669 RepID=A0A9Q0Y8P0_HOLLE|nr:Sushi-repeat-containing protein SRPX [Holothuria leucospilota]